MYEKFGRIWRKEYYVKQVSGKHFMRKYQGFGISKKVLGELVLLGVIFVLHVYNRTDGKKEYWLTSIKRYLESDKTYTFAGDDEQSFVSTRDMVLIEEPHDFFKR